MFTEIQCMLLVTKFVWPIWSYEAHQIIGIFIHKEALFFHIDV
jgi:hypothetical protein